MQEHGQRLSECIIFFQHSDLCTGSQFDELSRSDYREFGRSLFISIIRIGRLEYISAFFSKRAPRLATYFDFCRHLSRKSIKHLGGEKKNYTMDVFSYIILSRIYIILLTLQPFPNGWQQYQSMCLLCFSFMGKPDKI